MWMLQPYTRPKEITIDLPELLVDTLGFGAEVLANYLTALAEVGAEDLASHPAPAPILCRICERQIQAWWFEKHSDLCLQEHKAESEVQLAHETLTDHRTAIVKVLDGLEARKARPTSVEIPSNQPAPEYKGLPIGPSSSSSSSSTSGRATPPTPPRSREASSSGSGFGHSRAKSWAVRRPLSRIVELVLDLCDTALEVKTPALNEDRPNGEGEFKTQSPGSESRISQILNWQTPGSTSLEGEEGLATLMADTEQMARRKVETVVRHRRIIEYSERIRIEFAVLVEDCIEAAMRKAASIREGRLSDSSDTEDDAETPAPQNLAFSDKQAPSEGNAPPMSAMTSALRRTNDATSDNRRLSIALSTGSNSPIECPTPRSNAFPSGLSRQHSMDKRASLHGGSDAGDSDGSLSSSILSGGRRTASPGHDLAIARSKSHSSRERKRRSLKLPGVSASPRRQSPNRPSGPTSPMAYSRARFPSGTHDAIPSPITSPLMSSQDPPGSPADHRRQSSATSAAGFDKAPPSPRLGAMNQPLQPRALPPSIKDFEIIKPISRGAFGSVYLSKKKATGDYFAVKVLKKADMVAKNQVTNVKAERAIMMWQGESDFVAKLYWTFSSKDFLYLVMEYLNGGDCASLIKVLGGLPEDWAKKYLAEVVLGVEHLHSRGIVHRDLKPDNLLIDQKGHLKLTDFGLSRMGLIGRQKRLLKGPTTAVPDLLKSGPFTRPQSVASSRSTSFDFQGVGGHSPAATPLVTPDLASALGQPSYFSLGREPTLSREHSRRASGYRSDSGSSDNFGSMFKGLSLDDPPGRGAPIEEEGRSENSDSPDPYALQPTSSHPNYVTASAGPATGISIAAHGTPPQSGMPPPPMALFDPEDQNRRFVGTPDYLAPETIKGLGQDELSDWWSIGCILYEFLYGCPPFHAPTPEEVFENILARRVEWPTDDDVEVSKEARDLMEKLMTLEPKARLGANVGDRHASGGEEVRHHPWFMSINWDTLRDDEAQFVPNPENPEDTEYFDARGATLKTFAEELEDQVSSPPAQPSAEYQERPHDALSGLRKHVNSIKRGLMPLHIPAHVRDNRSRRLSEPVANDDFGTFTFKNLPVLEKANKDVIQKLKMEALKEQAKGAGQQLHSGNNSPSPSLEASPHLPSPLKRTLSSHKSTNRSASPSSLGQVSNASPNRLSQPTSPLLVQFSAGPHHERRKTSSASSSSQPPNAPLPAAGVFDPPRLPASLPSAPSTSSPIKSGRTPTSAASNILSPDKGLLPQRLPPSLPTPRTRSATLGSQDGSSEGGAPRPMSMHHKRRSQALDVSPSSSDNEDSRQKALLRVQRRRQSSRRMSQYSFSDGPCFRPLDILICEDHPISRLVMERLLEKLRCRTIAVTNGPDAVRFASSDVQFDVIMMEVKLPQMSGADVARMIRGTKNANQTTPIVAVTGYLKELPQSHHFDLLIEKPPTLEKLTDALERLCQWKAPPPDWHPGPLQHTPSGLRQESHPAEDSPSSPSTNPFSHVPGSSREDSITSSSYYGELDSQDSSQSHPSILAPPPNLGPGVPSLRGPIKTKSDDWAGPSRHGLGITEEPPGSAASFTHPGLPHLLPFNSAPPALGLIMPSPRKTRSSEAIRARRDARERQRLEGGTESGGDEDEELGRTPSGPTGTDGRPPAIPDSPRSPPNGGSARTRTATAIASRGSKLGTEMLRTNSRGSVVSGSEEILRSEAMLAAAAAAAFNSPADPAAQQVLAAATSPPVLSPHASVALSDGTASPTTARDPASALPTPACLEPPIVFPREAAGGSVAEFDMDATPRPSKTSSALGAGDTEPTPSEEPPTPVVPAKAKGDLSIASSPPTQMMQNLSLKDAPASELREPRDLDLPPPVIADLAGGSITDQKPLNDNNSA